ncbi:MAG TPA: BTAD domain-containing putative transcriptional regulator [Actinomycetota bacterium]
MALVAQLLGPPAVTRDGFPCPAPRGRKVWALFAYLALSERPPTRALLADLLFPEADDPSNALRWNLSELRRLLGGPETVGSGATVGLRLPGDSMIDVRVLQEGTSGEAVDLLGLGRELLEGVTVEASPGFAAWLLGERRRLQALGGSVLREGALRALAAGNPRHAVELATRLLGVDPLDEDAHVLLVRAFAATGDEVAVERQLNASLDLFRHELGVAPGTELYEAARMDEAIPRTTGAASGPAVRALLETGESAVRAGAVDVGIDSYRRAVAGAAETEDRSLEAEAQLALGAALVHAAKGRDEEGSAALHRAIATAESSGDRRRAAAAHRELGYAELLRGEYARSSVWLRSADELAGDDALERSRIRSVEGAGASDVGRHERGAELLREAIELARSVGNGRQVAWAMTCLGRAQLMCDELGEAEASLAEARDLTSAERWIAFVPYPESFLAEVWIRRGDLERAAEALQHSFTVACSVDDACWEAYSVRGLGLLRAADGDLLGSVGSMEDALTRCLRQQDTHRWIRAYVMDALCAVSIAAGHPRAAAWVTDLSSLAARCTMREFSVHAYLYRRDLGDGDALSAARTLALDVENPHLSRLLDGPEPSLLQDLLGAG